MKAKRNLLLLLHVGREVAGEVVDQRRDLPRLGMRLAVAESDLRRERGSVSIAFRVKTWCVSRCGGRAR